MFEAVLINLLSTGVTTGLSIGRDKFEKAVREREFSEDIDTIATEFNRSLKTEIVATAETIEGLDSTLLEQHWDRIAESVDDMETVYFDSEEAAIAEISEAILHTLDTESETREEIEPAVQQAVADSYTEAVDAFHDQVSGTELASQLGLESAEVLREELREVQSRVSELQQEFRHQEYFRLYDSADADLAVEAVSDWFPDIPYFEHDTNAPPTVTGPDRILFIGTKGVGKTRHLVRTIRQRDDYDHVLLPQDGIERARDLDPVADQIDGDVLLVWDDIHEVSRRRETWLFQAVVERLEDLVAEQGHSLLVAATVREDSLADLPGSLDDPEGFWQGFHRERLPSLTDDQVTRGHVIRHLLDYYDGDFETIDGRPRTEAMQRLREERFDAEFLYLVVAYYSEFESELPEAELPVGSERIWTHRYDEISDRSPDQRLVLEAVATLTALGLDPYYPVVEGMYREVYGQDAIQNRFRPHLEALLDQGWFRLEYDGGTAHAAGELPQSYEELQRAVVRLPDHQQVVPEPSRRVLEACSEFLRTSLEEYLPAGQVQFSGTIQTLDVIDGWMPFEYEPNFQVWCHHRYLRYLSGEAPSLYETVSTDHIEAMRDAADDPLRVQAIYGRKLWREGRHSQGSNYLQPVVEEGDPDEFPTAFGLYGVSLWTRHDDPAGVEYIHAAVKPQKLETPSRPHTLEANVYLHCGEHLRRDGDLKLALDVYQVGRRLAENGSPAIEARIGSTLASLDRLSEARDCFGAALNRHPESVELLREYGRFLWQQSDYDEAIPVLEKAVEAAGDPTRLYYMLAEAHEERGDTETAAELFEQARQQDTEFVDGRLSHIRFLLHQGRPEAAREVVQEGLDSPQVTSLPFVKGVAETCVSSGEPEMAIEYLIPPARSAFHADKPAQGATLTRRILEIAHEHELWEIHEEWEQIGIQSTPEDSQSRGEVLNGVILREAENWRADRGNEQSLVRTMFADRLIIHGRYQTAIPLLTAIWDDAHVEDDASFDDLYRLNAGPLLAALAVLTDDVSVDPATIDETLQGELHRLRKETRTLLRAAVGENVDRSPEDMAEESGLTHDDITPLASVSERTDQHEGDVRRLACAELLHQILWQQD